MLVSVGILFDLSHVLYILFSSIIIALILFLAKRFLVKQNHKDTFLKVFAILTVFLHISPLWVSFLQGNDAIAADNMLFPIYFCNLTMYLLVVVAFYSDKTKKSFKVLSMIVAYAGIFGAIITLFYPEFYIGSSSILEYGVFKSMASHSTMLIFSSYLFVGKYFEVSKKDGLIYFIGMLFYALVGFIVNITFDIFGLGKPNAMYLQAPPISEVPFLNSFVIGILFTLIVGFIGYKSGLEKEKRLEKQIKRKMGKINDNIR